MTDTAESEGQLDQVANEGPEWASRSLDVEGGRFPLSVEAHLLNMTAELVPGATTVTTSARYYTLHGAVALEAERRQLDLPARLELLRRCEVVMAAASIINPSQTAGTVHGLDAILKKSSGVLFDVETLSTPKIGYSDAQYGFLGPYLGSEMTLGILSDGSLTPGQRVASSSFGNAFEGLFDLARQDQISKEALQSASHLAIGHLGVSEDGEWLARQLCVSGLSHLHDGDHARAGTVRLLVRSLELEPSRRVLDSFRKVVSYGSWARVDPVVSSIPEVQPWRGTLFRHDSVGAWRQLWAWLVDAINGPTRKEELIEKFAAHLPDMTLSAFVRDLPPIVDSSGDPFDAESLVRGQDRTVPSQSLGLLILGSQRAKEMTGRSRGALVGKEQRVAVLSPLWMAEWVASRSGVHLGDVASQLTDVLLDRAKRIAMNKMRIRNGKMWLPSVVAERGEFLYTVGKEGRGNVGLRLEQLAGLLQGVGVLELVGESLALSTRGTELLRGTV